MRFLDGPAEGLALDARRCPTYLRVVCGGEKGTMFAGQRWDALDQPDDEPEDDEAIFAYRIVDGSHGVVFVRPGGRFESGDYRYLPVRDDLLERFRVRDHFLAWAVLDHARRVLRRDDGWIATPAAADLAGIDEHRFRAAAVEIGAEGDFMDQWRLRDA